MQNLTKHTLKECGVDWITVTSREGDHGERLLREGDRLVQEEALFGNDVRPWSHKGFSGWSCGGVDIGKRFDCSIVRLRSSTAREYWWEVFQEATNCSRLDLQATADFTPVDPARVLNRCWSIVRKVKSYGKSQSWRMIQDASAGNTLQLGRRVSDRFARVYDKKRESGLEYYEGCVRFELELKNNTALRYAIAIADGSLVQERILSIVQSYFQERGLLLDLEFAGAEPIRFPRSAPDIVRWLTWAAIGVKPRVQKCIEHGKLTELLDVLGLTDFVSVCDRRNGPSGPSRPKEKTNGNLGSNTHRSNHRPTP